MLPPIGSGVVAQIGDLEKGLGDIGRSRRGQRLAGRHDRGMVERVIAIAACDFKEEFDGKSARPGRGRQPEFRRRNRTEIVQLEDSHRFAQAGAPSISQPSLVQIARNFEQVAELDVRVAGRGGVERHRIGAKGPREVAPVLQAMTAHHDIVDPVRREFGRVGETFGGAKVFPVADCLFRLSDQSVFDRDSRNGFAPVHVSGGSLLEAAEAWRDSSADLSWTGAAGPALSA